MRIALLFVFNIKTFLAQHKSIIWWRSFGLYARIQLLTLQMFKKNHTICKYQILLIHYRAKIFTLKYHRY